MKKIGIILAFLLILSLTAGCGGSSKAIKTVDGNVTVNGDKIEVKDDKGNQSTVSLTDGKTVVESSDGKASIGENVELPKGYPKDLVPLYELETVTVVFEDNEGGYTVSYNSKASLSAVIDFYKKVIADFEDKQSTVMGEGAYFVGTKGGKAVQVTITQCPEDSKKSTIMVFIESKK